LEKELLDTYYNYKGWNEEGIPTEASLHELGLDFVSADLIQRGILTAGGDTLSEEASAVKETN
jgi:benzoyl-CoA reductase subunit BamB